MPRSFLTSLRTLILALTIGLGINYAYAAWSAPTATPPGGNIDAPLNISDSTQYKAGNLVLNNSAAPFVNGLIVAAGKVGIGSVNPATTLGVAGSVGADQYCTQDGSSCISSATLVGSGGGSFWSGSGPDIQNTNSGNVNVATHLNVTGGLGILGQKVNPNGGGIAGYVRVDIDGTSYALPYYAILDPILATFNLFGGAYNGGEQIAEHDAIRAAMQAGGVYQSSDVNSQGRLSVAHFTANNKGYFDLVGVGNVGAKMTIMHWSDGFGVYRNICGSIVSGGFVRTLDKTGCSTVGEWGRTNVTLELRKGK